VVNADVRDGRLVRVLPAYALPGSPLYVVSAPLRHVPARVSLLRDFLLRELAALAAGTPCAVRAEAPPEAPAAHEPVRARARSSAKARKRGGQGASGAHESRS